MLYLVRSPLDKAWYCQCEIAPINAPYHDEETFPAGGTGWMFTCANCRKGFDIAVARQIDESLESLSRRCTPRVRKVVDARTGQRHEEVLIKDPEEWTHRVEPLLAGLTMGQSYVFFDGAVLPYKHGPVKFKGLYREHDLPDLPHIAGSPIGDLLGESDYWRGEPTEPILARLRAKHEEEITRQQTELDALPLLRRLSVRVRRLLGGD